MPMTFLMWPFWQSLMNFQMSMIVSTLICVPVLMCTRMTMRLQALLSLVWIVSLQCHLLFRIYPGPAFYVQLL